MERCGTCQLVHEKPLLHEESLRPCVDAQATAMKKLLQLVGEPGICRGCQAPIYWMRHRMGAAVPYNSAGLNHFIDCPEREQFRKNRKVASR